MILRGQCFFFASQEAAKFFNKVAKKHLSCSGRPVMLDSQKKIIVNKREQRFRISEC